MKVQRLPSGRYRARVWDARLSREVSKVFKLKAEAEAWRAKTENKRNTGTLTDPSLGRITLAGWFAHYLEHAGHLRPSTRSSYEGAMRNLVLPKLGRRRLSDLTHQDCQNWAAELATDGKSTAYIHTAYRVLRAVLDPAVKADRIATNPAKELRLKVTERKADDKRFLTFEELERLADAVGEVDARYRGFVLFLGYSGLRIGEAAALKTEHVETDARRHRVVVRVLEGVSVVDGRIHVGPTKTGHNRVVTLTGSIADDLLAHLKAYPPQSGLVFPAPGGGYLNRHNFYNRVWLSALKRAGLAPPQPRVHDLRHTAVSLAIASGANIKQVQIRAGHSSVKVTLDVYGHLFPGDDEAVAEALDEGRRAALEGFRHPVGMKARNAKVTGLEKRR
jgi:integrase